MLKTLKSFCALGVVLVSGNPSLWSSQTQTVQNAQDLGTQQDHVVQVNGDQLVSNNKQSSGFVNSSSTTDEADIELYIGITWNDESVQNLKTEVEKYIEINYPDLGGNQDFQDLLELLFSNTEEYFDAALPGTTYFNELKAFLNENFTSFFQDPVSYISEQLLAIWTDIAGSNSGTIVVVVTEADIETAKILAAFQGKSEEYIREELEEMEYESILSDLVTAFYDLGPPSDVYELSEAYDFAWTQVETWLSNYLDQSSSEYKTIEANLLDNNSTFQNIINQLVGGVLESQIPTYETLPFLDVNTFESEVTNQIQSELNDPESLLLETVLQEILAQLDLLEFTKAISESDFIALEEQIQTDGLSYDSFLKLLENQDPFFNEAFFDVLDIKMTTETFPTQDVLVSLNITLKNDFASFENTSLSWENIIRVENNLTDEERIHNWLDFEMDQLEFQTFTEGELRRFLNLDPDEVLVLNESYNGKDFLESAYGFSTDDFITEMQTYFDTYFENTSVSFEKAEFGITLEYDSTTTNYGTITVSVGGINVNDNETIPFTYEDVSRFTLDIDDLVNSDYIQNLFEQFMEEEYGIKTAEQADQFIQQDSGEYQNCLYELEQLINEELSKSYSNLFVSLNSVNSDDVGASDAPFSYFVTYTIEDSSVKNGSANLSKDDSFIISWPSEQEIFDQALTSLKAFGINPELYGSSSNWSDYLVPSQPNGQSWDEAFAEVEQTLKDAISPDIILDVEEIQSDKEGLVLEVSLTVPGSYGGDSRVYTTTITFEFQNLKSLDELEQEITSIYDQTKDQFTSYFSEDIIGTDMVQEILYEFESKLTEIRDGYLQQIVNNPDLLSTSAEAQAALIAGFTEEIKDILEETLSEIDWDAIKAAETIIEELEDLVDYGDIDNEDLTNLILENPEFFEEILNSVEDSDSLTSILESVSESDLIDIISILGTVGNFFTEDYKYIYFGTGAALAVAAFLGAGFTAKSLNSSNKLVKKGITSTKKTGLRTASIVSAVTSLVAFASSFVFLFVFFFQQGGF